MNIQKSTAKIPISRTRNYATIIYPESAPADWLEKLDALHIPAFLSPLHDKDKLPDGSFKKAHYHLLLSFSSVKTKKQAEAIFSTIGGVGTEIVNCLSAYARYLVHMDNPEKAQYNPDDVIVFAGADYNAVTYVPEDDISIIADIIDYIDTNQITSFAKLARLCKDNNPEWLRILVLKKTTYFFFQYLRSREWDTEHHF